MKKITILSLIITFCFAGITANAQDQGDLRATVGLAFGTKAAIDETGTKGGLGINAGVEYFATDVISVAPSFTYFFPSSVTFFGTEIETKPSSLNVDGRYYFGDGEAQLYGLAGLSFAFAKTTVGGESQSDSEVGLNLGGGLQYPLSDGMFLNGQVKYNTPYEQLVLNAGITFSL